MIFIALQGRGLWSRQGFFDIVGVELVRETAVVSTWVAQCFDRTVF
jgi:hypothetical protein